MNNKSYKLGKTCSICGKQIIDSNKGGKCSLHRDRTGKNNPFYGKHHDKKTIEATKIKLKEISKDLWKDEGYREKVINAISKPRREGFKKEQSERITQWYRDNPEQLDIRREAMKESWKSGSISYNEHSSYNSSKIEKSLLYDIQQFCSEAQEHYTIKTTEKWYLPDIYIESKKIIIELYGEYWHAHPDRYQEEDVVHHNVKAKDIWNRDKIRENVLTELGYTVIIIWSEKYKKDKENTLSYIRSLLC